MKYQNTSDQDLVIPNVGVVAKGAIIESATPVENPNLKLISEAPQAQPAAPAQPQAQYETQPKPEGVKV